MAETARTKFILPSYKIFAQRLTSLGRRAETLCETPSTKALAATRAAYRDAIAAWGRAEIIVFGPVRRKNRFERIFFWPDRNSIGQRQIHRILGKRDAAASDPLRLARKSVAVQGLTALEVLLFGDGADRFIGDSSNNFRCRYAKSIIQNVSSIVDKIRADWADHGAFTQIWRAPGPNNPAYLDPRETTLELVKSFDQTLEHVRDRRIVPAIGFGPQRRVRRPVLWRSRLSMPLVHANIKAARDLLVGGGLSEAYLHQQNRSPEATGAMESIVSELKLTLKTTGALADEHDPFAAGNIKDRLIAIGFPLKNIRAQAVLRLKHAAGLSVGFNASDGD